MHKVIQRHFSVSLVLCWPIRSRASCPQCSEDPLSFSASTFLKINNKQLFNSPTGPQKPRNRKQLPTALRLLWCPSGTRPLCSLLFYFHWASTHELFSRTTFILPCCVQDNPSSESCSQSIFMPVRRGGCWGCDVDTHIKIHIRELFSDIYIELLQVLTFLDVCRQFSISELCLQ